MLKVLYAAYRHDPLNPDLSSGADYNFYSSMQRSGMQVKVAGPIIAPAILPERAIIKLYKFVTGRKYAKFPLSLAWQSSQIVGRAARDWNPDVIFTMFPPTLVFYRGLVPCIYRLDTCFRGWNEEYPEFGRLAMGLLTWEENEVFKKCARIITHSEWTRAILINDYGIAGNKIEVFANPSALPMHVVPKAFEPSTEKVLDLPLRLLLVGRDHHRKGIDIALEIVGRLNTSGIPTNLTVCGTSGTNTPNVRFVGTFKKSNPEQLAQYTALYRDAHMLLHPARFDPSPIVPSEAAAFGTPTITNATGGIATSVQDGVSGIVLPKGCPPEAYVQAIKDLIYNPTRYTALCTTTRQRYERELNWTAAGKRVTEIVTQVVEADQGSYR